VAAPLDRVEIIVIDLWVVTGTCRSDQPSGVDVTWSRSGRMWMPRTLRAGGQPEALARLVTRVGNAVSVSDDYR